MPFRLMILHLSHIFLTDGLTFIMFSLNTPYGQSPHGYDDSASASAAGPPCWRGFGKSALRFPGYCFCYTEHQWT